MSCNLHLQGSNPYHAQTAGHKGCTCSMHAKKTQCLRRSRDQQCCTSNIVHCTKTPPTWPEPYLRDATCGVGDCPLVWYADYCPHPLSKSSAWLWAAVLCVKSEGGGLARRASHVGQG